MLRKSVLQGKRFRRTMVPLAWAAVLACVSTRADAPAAAPVVPLTVCEVLRDLSEQAGKTVAVLGRYSYRVSGDNWISEDSCGSPSSSDSDGKGRPPETKPQLAMTVDKNGPRLPDDYELDGATLHRKLAEMQRHTTLAKFRFGTPDYDRWAVVWGRIEARKPDEHGKAAADLYYRGEGTIYYITQ